MKSKIQTIKTLRIPLLLSAVALFACTDESERSEAPTPVKVEQDMTDPAEEDLFTDQMQIAAELRAFDLMSAPEVKAAQEKLRTEVYLPRAGQSKDRLKTLDDQLDEIAFAGTLWTSTNDPANPSVIWFNNPPHITRGKSISGGRFGTDNADRVYRYFAVDPAYKYELFGRRSVSSPPTQFNLEACEDKPAAWGYPLKFLLDDEIEYEDDGSFVITVDASPAEGRKNHLQLPEGSAHVNIRDTIVDWNKETPTLVSVRRVSGPDVIAPLSDEMIRQRIGQAIHDQSFYGIGWEDHPVVGMVPAIVNEKLNVFVRPTAPGQKAWGVTGPGQFKIADDEAVVITIDRQSARYVGIQITNPWLFSTDYVNHTMTLNHTQVFPNPDNTLTYVIAKSDPGVQNWLDTVGLNEVGFMLRMELFEDEPNPETVVRKIELVNLSDVKSALPHAMPDFSAEQRRAQIDSRRQGYARRAEILAPSR